MSIFNSNISTKEAGITTDLLDKITNAYNQNDIDKVMSFFAEDVVFDHATGPNINGTRFSGLDTIRGIFEGLFNSVESVQWTPIDTGFLETKLTVNFIDLQNSNLVKLKTF